VRRGQQFFPAVGNQVFQFDSGSLAGVQAVLVYYDDLFNIRLQMETVQVMTQTLVPVTGQVMSKPSQYGLGVVLDVNNKDIHPMDPQERRCVLDRANGLWPRGVLEFLNQRRLP
jgi:hypothetical protein